jgi:alanyl-tRNA synthetase
MKKLNYHEIRKMWLDFYRERQHAVIPSAPIVPENDGSVLFTTAGMHPLVPYLLGERHPAGTRLANVQKCLRTNDIESVGDMGHLTFFEMMGNWSLGDYFKKEKIAWSYEFLTSPKYLDIPKDLISVSCWVGNDTAPRDTVSAQLWEEIGIPRERIFFLSENWWGLDSGGPCGPCSEMFMDTGKPSCGVDCNPSCDCGRYLEVGNDVYMEYVSTGGKIELAKQKNVDTGMGLERLLCMCNGFKSVYESELFAPVIEKIALACGKKYNPTDEFATAFRIVAEHTRAATVIISDSVMPTNTGAGYVLRRLIRRAVRMANRLGVVDLNATFGDAINWYIDMLGVYYLNLIEQREHIIKAFCDEVAKFEKTLLNGLREFEKIVSYLKTAELSGKTAFRLYDTYGFPLEVTQELAAEKGLTINMTEYDDAKEKHAVASGAGATGVFKGGLADTGTNTAHLHTATHLLLATLKQIYGDSVVQKGSNITPERLRFDFNVDHKLEPAEIAEIEKRINAVIAQKLPVTMKEMSIAEAKAMNATGTFADKYGDIVKVYSIGDYSSEICGGPHAANTAELGVFKIAKEESVSAGIRRIKATLSSK